MATALESATATRLLGVDLIDNHIPLPINLLHQPRCGNSGDHIHTAFITLLLDLIEQ